MTFRILCGINSKHSDISKKKRGGGGTNLKLIPKFYVIRNNGKKNFCLNALKTWVLHVNTFYSWILLYIYRPWQPLTYLCFPYCISLIYFSFTKIRMFLYAQIYWLAESGDVSCLQFNYLRVETLIPTWEDLVGHLSDNFKSEVRQNSVSNLSVWSLIHLEGSV